ncbi:MAG TPA: hypothetical protein VM537_14740 [Anaerolineae bacterium]|nr:hypothetical protein [Anaerolineae bacterium]
MKCKWFVGLAVLTFAACNGDSPTGPSVQDSAVSTGSVQSAAVDITPVVSPTPSPNQNAIDVKVGPDGTVNVFNTQASRYEANICYFWKGAHPQTQASEPLSISVAPGRKASFPFPDIAFDVESEATCSETRDVQVDVGFIECTNPSNGLGQIHAFGYVSIKSEGEGVEEIISEIRSETKWGECGPTTDLPAEGIQQCQASKCGQQGEYNVTTTYKNTCSNEERTSIVDFRDFQSCECPPPPCEEEWVEQKPVIENVGKWSECRPGTLNFTNTIPPVYTECEGVMSRNYDKVVYEVNSCTQETREKTRRSRTEESPCGYQCLASLTHTENKKYCGWLGCSNKYYWGSSVKWQCQSVPPGAPGHYDNHFNKNGHDDFFGEPTAEKCYNVTN